MDWTTTLDLGSASSSSSDLLEKGNRECVPETEVGKFLYLGRHLVDHRDLPTLAG
jgi:hypothetical protein